MIHPRKQTCRSGQILILLLASFLGGSALIGAGIFATGRSIDEIADRVDGTVADKGRRASAREVLLAWRKEGDRFLEANTERYGKLLEELERHGARSEGLRARFDEMRAANLRIQATVLERRFALRSILTREEWQRVFPR